MAAAFTGVLAESAAGAGTSFATTGTLGPAASELDFVLVVGRASAGTLNAPTLSGGGQAAWAAVFTQKQANTIICTLFRAQATSPGAAAALTATFDGAATMTAISILAGKAAGGVGGVFDDSANNGAGCIVQSAGNSSNSGTTASCTLASFADAANNVCFAAGAAATNNTPAASGGSLAAIETQHAGSPNRCSILEWQLGENLAPAFTMPTSNWAILAVEVKATVAAGKGYRKLLLGVG